MGDIIINETEDYKALVGLFIEQGLEFGEGDEVATDVVKCWDAREQGALVGGCVLAKRQGRFICDGIAVVEDARDLGVGARLLDIMLGEARALGAAELFLVARTPGFFAHNGFEEVSRADAPEFFECFTCPQYERSCWPQVMRRGL